MKYVPKQDDDEEFTTLRLTKRLRRKLGILVDGNKRVQDKLEEMIDRELAKL